jgi:hypothetical protein
MQKAMWLSLALLTFCDPRAGLAEEVKEPHSGVGFPAIRSWGSYKLRCVGTALRKKFGFKVYAGCLYVDTTLGKEKLEKFLASPAAGGALAGGKLDVQKLLGNERFYAWLVASDLPISVDMTFVRDVSAEKIRETYKEGLSVNLRDGKVMDRFLAQADRDLKKWDHLTLNLMPGGRVTLQMVQKTSPVIESPALARALLAIYFGHKPISDEIKRSLVERIDLLLR